MRNLEEPNIPGNESPPDPTKNITYLPEGTTLKETAKRTRHGVVMTDDIGREYYPLPEGVDSFRNGLLTKKPPQSFGSLEPNQYTQESIPKLQQAISLLLKGIINVSDVIEHEGHYYSVSIKHKDIEDKTSRRRTFLLSSLILGDIFRDYDHVFSSSAQNNVSYEENTYSFHDFEGASYFKTNPALIILKSLRESSRQRFLELGRAIDTDDLDFLLTKLSELTKRFEDVDFVTAVFKKTGFDTKKSFSMTEANFSKTVIKRCNKVKNLIEKAKEYKKLHLPTN